ncbi:MAG: hypothetical protein ACKVS9_04530 [Phycisphaerae bacterium]
MSAHDTSNGNSSGAPMSRVERIVRRGEEIYEAKLRAILEPAHVGEFLVLDIDTGEYEVDADEVAALLRAKSKRETGNRYLGRIGFRAAHRIGGRSFKILK